MNTSRNPQAFTLVEIMIVVVLIGLLASLAVPAFQKIRSSSQDKAVLNNLRQILFASEQYYLESGMTSVDVTLLIGTSSTHYIKEFQTIAGEQYAPVHIQGGPITATGVAGARTITYVN